MYKRSQQGWLKHIDFILLDLGSLILAFVLALLLRFGTLIDVYGARVYANTGVFMVVVSLLMTVLLNTMHNVISRGYIEELKQTLKQGLFTFAGTLIYLFSVKDSEVVSRIVLWLAIILYVVLGYGTRVLWKTMLKRRGIGDSRHSMLLIADTPSVEEVLQRFEDHPVENIHVSGIVLVDRDAAGETVRGTPVVANLGDAARYICREWIDEVYVCVSDATHRPNELVRRCSEMGVTVHQQLLMFGMEGDKQIVQKMAGCAVVTSSMNIVTPGQMLIKRIMDVLGGLLGSLLALIVIAIVGPKIRKVSPGPILFKQERIGQNGKHFKMYKIRSMYLDAEERKQALMEQNRVADGRMFKLDFDPRIIGNEILPDGTKKTGIGEFIRRTSLDEMPQFFNILRGEMSLVGTRPPTLDEWEKYEYHHRARLSIKPGLTGMWQVSGRSKVTDFEEVVRLDTEYINSWSIAMDIRILFKTIMAVIRRDGAM